MTTMDLTSNPYDRKYLPLTTLANTFESVSNATANILLDPELSSILYLLYGLGI